jgi:ABC-type uncharacterized transport system YnjBCD substrate-binding protein
MEIPEEVWVQWDQDGRQDDSEDDTRTSQKSKGKKWAWYHSLDAMIKLKASADSCSKKKKGKFLILLLIHNLKYSVHWASQLDGPWG